MTGKIAWSEVGRSLVTKFRRKQLKQIPIRTKDYVNLPRNNEPSVTRGKQIVSCLDDYSIIFQ